MKLIKHTRHRLPIFDICQYYVEISKPKDWANVISLINAGPNKVVWNEQDWHDYIYSCGKRRKHFAFVKESYTGCARLYVSSEAYFNKIKKVYDDMVKVRIEYSQGYYSTYSVRYFKNTKDALMFKMKSQEPVEIIPRAGHV